jgi:hypothetical protein
MCVFYSNETCSRGKIKWLVGFRGVTETQAENGIETRIPALRTAGSKEETTYHHHVSLMLPCPALASRIGFRASPRA